MSTTQHGDGTETRGFLYVAVGEGFVAEARESARSVRRHHDEPIAIAADVDVDPTGPFDDVLPIEDPAHGAHEQIRRLHASPYDRTVKLDTDTYLTDGVHELFDLLDRFDVAAAHDTPWTGERENYPVEGVPRSFPEYNGGVLVYRNDDDLAAFQARWADEYEAHRNADPPYNQPSLRKALYDSPLRVATLPLRYNCKFEFLGRLSGRAKILHGRLRHLDSYGNDRNYDVETVERTLNETTEPRVFVARGDRIEVYTKRKPSRVRRFVVNLRTRGVGYTLKETARYLSRRVSG